MKHGTDRAYCRDQCRCPDCTTAHTEAQRAWRLRRGHTPAHEELMCVGCGRWVQPRAHTQHERACLRAA